MSNSIQFKLESNPGPVTEMGATVYLSTQTFRTATELLRARAQVVGSSRVVVEKVGK